MSSFFVYAEPTSVSQGIAMIVAMIVISIVLIVVGGYVFVRIIAYVLNSYQGNWESSAKRLGLNIAPSAGGLYKPLVGERDGARIAVTHFGIAKGTGRGARVIHCALVEVGLKEPLGFSLKLSRRETFFEKAVAHVFDESDEVGNEPFDKIFKVECADLGPLRSLLSVEMMDNESSTIITDLILAAKKYPRVLLTDSSLSLGVKAEVGQAELIEPVITKAIYLASRVDAAKKLAAS